MGLESYRPRNIEQSSGQQKSNETTGWESLSNFRLETPRNGMEGTKLTKIDSLYSSEPSSTDDESVKPLDVDELISRQRQESRESIDQRIAEIEELMHQQQTELDELRMRQRQRDDEEVNELRQQQQETADDYLKALFDEITGPDN